MQDTKRCPKCGSGNMLPIRYGYPPPEMVEESYVGRVVLGGCILFPRPPLRQLRARKARPPVLSYRLEHRDWVHFVLTNRPERRAGWVEGSVTYKSGF